MYSARFMKTPRSIQITGRSFGTRSPAAAATETRPDTAGSRATILRRAAAAGQAKCPPVCAPAAVARVRGTHTTLRPLLTKQRICRSIVPGHNSWTQSTRRDMPEIEYAKARRSSRVFMRVRVVAAGKNPDSRKFREACETMVINAHGGLLYLNQRVENSAMVVLINPFTQEEQECRVVYLGDTSEKGQRVGVEFLSPAPRFWGVE